MRIALFLIAAAILSFPINGHTSSDSITAGPHYRALVFEAFTNPGNGNFNFQFLRSYYATSQYYDPLSENSLKALFTAAHTVKNDPDPKNQKRALQDFKDLVYEHLANYDVVEAALGFALDDPRFGDPDFFKWVLAGLVQSVKNSGNGTSLTKAYDIITLGEERALFNILNVRPVAIDTAQESVVYYNMNKVQDLENGAVFTLFTNVTIPMTHLEKSHKLKERQPYK